METFESTRWYALCTRNSEARTFETTCSCGSIDAGWVLASTNDIAFGVGLNSVGQFGVGYPSFMNNNTTDVYAYGMSYISFDRKQQPAPIISPATNPGNSNSWIDLSNSAYP